MKANTSSPDRRVTTIDDLIAACRDTGARRVIVNGTLENAPSIRLAPGQALLGEDDHGSIAFAHGVDGLQLTTDNQVSGLRLTASPDKRVIFNDTQVAGLGRMRLAGITAVGQVQILVREAVMSGHVDVEGLDIVAADARARSERPHGFGVYVLQGAFTR